MANNAQVRQRSGLVPDWRLGFFGIWAGQAISLVGSNLVQFALIWWLAKAQHSATILAVAHLAGTLPVVLIGPIAGVLIDLWTRPFGYADLGLLHFPFGMKRILTSKRCLGRVGRERVHCIRGRGFLMELMFQIRR